MRVTQRIASQIAATCQELGLTALVLMCGRAQLQAVAQLAEHFVRTKHQTTVIGVPAGGDHLAPASGQLPHRPHSLGFESACSVLCEVAGNITLTPPLLGEEVYRFVCCGSAALTLEVALQIQPTLCLLSEDIADEGLTLEAIIDKVCDVIVERHHSYGTHTGIILVSEELYDELSEMRELQAELERLHREHPADMRSEEKVRKRLPPALRRFLELLPPDMCKALIFRNESRALNLADPEREIARLVSRCLAERAASSKPSVPHFTPYVYHLCHIVRCPTPTPFDCALGHALGFAAGLCATKQLSGYAPSLVNTAAPIPKWATYAMPLARLLNDDGTSAARQAKLADGPLFEHWRRAKESWRFKQCCRQPGPAQHWLGHGEHEVTAGSHTLAEGSTLARVASPPPPFVAAITPEFLMQRRSVHLLTPVQQWRLGFKPSLPDVLKGPFVIAASARDRRVCANVRVLEAAFPGLFRAKALSTVGLKVATQEMSQSKMPVLVASPTGVHPVALRVGIVLIGQSGPGLNNVVEGIFDWLHPMGGTVVCIAMGQAGLAKGIAFELTAALLEPHRNQGGCDLLGQSESEEPPSGPKDLACIAKSLASLRLDGLVVCGGRCVHAWTARLAEFLAVRSLPTCVVAVPLSIASDFPFLEQAIGYDTVCKQFASVVGNLATQAMSYRSIWYFVRVSGSRTSQVACELEQEACPHLILMSELVERGCLSLNDVTEKICGVITARSQADMNFGVVLFPEGLLNAIFEMRQLFSEVQEIKLTSSSFSHQDVTQVLDLLSPISRALFSQFPQRVRAQLCSAQTVDLAEVETELVFKVLVEMELTRRVMLGTYTGSFQCITYSLAKHGFSAMPTNFDCDLGYTMGQAAGIFVQGQQSGLLVEVSRLKREVDEWEVCGTPLPSLMTFSKGSEGSGAGMSYVIEPQMRFIHEPMGEQYMFSPCERPLVNPGPTQFMGPCAGRRTHMASLPQMQDVSRLAETTDLILELKSKASAGCPAEVLQSIKTLLQGSVELFGQL
eukprot:NODE_113_length_3622_cov_3.400572.p1 GENE.NODE_113_length_3622_cov_3.400572~~NODE_113_length_3622_cov_3.400572.p1  ORF type:complete len:1021 (-),score=319.81 NODE_113_length_3622_cov_3.400572:66-3128(-)